MKRVDEIAKVCPLHFVEMEPGKLIPHTSTKVHFYIGVVECIAYFVRHQNYDFLQPYNKPHNYTNNDQKLSIITELSEQNNYSKTITSGKHIRVMYTPLNPSFI